MRPSLARRVEHERIITKVIVYGGRYHHVANLRTPEKTWTTAFAAGWKRRT